ncbi:MAG: hypothetical protein JW947_08660 [Sedimentisphaerales bacterium]|nr:hypothetical protein [Sedimentisphaerales bacterium]
MNGIEPLYHLKENMLRFISFMKSRTVAGYYRYSYSGDLYDEGVHWNPAGSVFALKIYYTLGVEDNRDIDAAANYIKTFQHTNGWIYDSLVFRKSAFRNAIASLRQANFSNLLNTNYKRAETRQCYSALTLYDKLPESTQLPVPRNEQQVSDYLDSLPWNCPWDAASHFSHLMFFLALALKTGEMEQQTFERLTKFAAEWTNCLQHPQDGCWYTGDPSLRQKINGAMKVITGLLAADMVDFAYPEKLIDLCLSSKNDLDACDNFNIIFVLNYASKSLDKNYRRPEIEDFALQRLNMYWKHYHNDKNGFSFYPNRANDIYYGARITRGLNEPDIHGTSLFLWGISIIVQLLGIEKEFGFKEFKT